MNFESSLIDHHKKAVRVVLSCKTLDQLKTAEKYCEYLFQLHESNWECSASGFQKGTYLQKRIESNEKLKLCIKDQRKKIILRGR